MTFPTSETVKYHRDMFNNMSKIQGAITVKKTDPSCGRIKPIIGTAGQLLPLTAAFSQHSVTIAEVIQC